MTRQGRPGQQEDFRTSGDLLGETLSQKTSSRRCIAERLHCIPLLNAALVAAVTVLLSMDAVQAQQQDDGALQLLVDSNVPLCSTATIALSSESNSILDWGLPADPIDQKGVDLSDPMIDRPTDVHEADGKLHNLIAAGGLSLAFSIGLIITISTTRQTARLPQRVLGR